MLRQVLLFPALLALAGCRTQRFLEITSTPPGAEVRLDDQSIGHTPLSVPFEHYGTRRLTFYLAGYRTLSERIHLSSPWYARFPFDVVMEVLLPVGLSDHRRYHQDLVPGEEVMGLPSLRSVIERANVLRQSGPEGPRHLPDVHPEVVPAGADENGDAAGGAPPTPEPKGGGA